MQHRPNYELKGLIIAKYGTLFRGAQDFGLREDRLSRIVHGRVHPSDSEKRRISLKLQRQISELFPENHG